MNRTEKYVRQYLRSSCDQTSSLQPDLKLVCSNGSSYAHKFALLSVLPDLANLFCSPCLHGHDPVTLILPDITTEVVNEARDFLYMYGEVGSLAKIFGMKKVKEKIPLPANTFPPPKNKSQDQWSIIKEQTVPEKRTSDKIREKTQPLIVPGDSGDHPLRKDLRENSERQKVLQATYPGIGFHKVEKASATEQKIVQPVPSNPAANGEEPIHIQEVDMIVSKKREPGKKSGKRKKLRKVNDNKKQKTIKEAMGDEKTVDVNDDDVDNMDNWFLYVSRLKISATT